MNAPENHFTLQDQGTEPRGETTVHVQQSVQGVVVEFRNEQGVSLASAVIELHNGRLKLYAWDEADE